MTDNQSLQSELHLGAGAYSYHFQLRTTGDGSRFLVIDEIQANQHNSIKIPEDQWIDFLDYLTQAMESNPLAAKLIRVPVLEDFTIFERVDTLVSDAYGKRTNIRKLLENAGLDSIQSGQILQDFRGEVCDLVMENIRSYLQTRQHGDIMWKIIVDHYGLAGTAPRSYQEIADKLDTSTEKAQQFVEQALRRLRLQQRRRRLEASLQLQAAKWLGVQVVEKSGDDRSAMLEKSIPEYMLNTTNIYPRAYEPWTTGEEEELMALGKEGYPVDELAVHFGRQPGVIRARLEKLFGRGD